MAQLKEGSIIRKSTGDEIIATINDLAGGGSIVYLGAFGDETAVITHVVMNQLPSGHYTFFMNASPFFMLLNREPGQYYGTFQTQYAEFFYFRVSFYGEMYELKRIDLRTLMTDVPL